MSINPPTALCSADASPEFTRSPWVGLSLSKPIDRSMSSGSIHRAARAASSHQHSSSGGRRCILSYPRPTLPLISCPNATKTMQPAWGPCVCVCVPQLGPTYVRSSSGAVDQAGIAHAHDKPAAAGLIHIFVYYYRHANDMFRFVVSVSRKRGQVLVVVLSHPCTSCL